MVSTSEIREAPVFHEPLINVEVITGQPLHLECQGIICEGRNLKMVNSTNVTYFSVSGIPTPDLTWKHNNKPIMLNNPGYDIHYDQHTQWASLNVKEAFPKVCTQLAYYKLEDQF